MKKVLSLSCLIGILTTGCSSDEPSSEENSNPKEEVEQIEVKPLPQLSAAEEAAAEAQAAFCTDFFAGVNREYAGANVATSPLSASLLLSLLANGCDAATRAQICTLLRCDDIDAVNSLSKKYMEWLPGADENVTIRLANSLWYKSVYTLNPAFAAIASDCYAAETFARDFGKKSALLDEINAWTKRKTGNIIEKILDNINPSCEAIQINTLYFKGAWTDSFSKEATRKANFYAGNGTVKADMMNIESDFFKYAESEAYQIVDLPYGNNLNVCMSVILPAEGIDIDEFIASDNFKAAASTATQYECVQLTMPKFKIEPAENINLTEVLAALGADRLSQLQSCSFFTEPTDLKFNIYQKVGISVDEEGTEAAAATWSGWDGASGITPEPIRVEVNRPFVFLIKEKTSGLTLFAGKLTIL